MPSSQDRPARLRPVVDEGGAQAVHRRPTDSEVRVAPLAFVTGITGPLIGDADPAGERDDLVADEDLAVRAVLPVPDARRPQRPEPRHVDAGLGHAVDPRPIDASGAQGIEQHPDPNAGPCALRERLSEDAPDVAVPVDEGQQVDGPLGRPDGVEHRGEDLVAVVQHVDLVALRRGDAQEALEATAVANGGSSVIVGHRATMPHADPSRPAARTPARVRAVG
jgi:hypothetical protein